MPQPDYETITYEVSSAVATITLARPDTLNLIGETVFHELTDAFVRARFEPGVSIVVLQSTGKMFSAGGDLNGSVTDLVRAGPSNEMRTEMFRHVYGDYPIFHAIENCPHTVIAALNGPAMGAAVTLVMMCDLVVAAETAKLTFAPGRWGIADAPSAARLSQKVGMGAAKDLLFTARTITADVAFHYGLVQRLCPPEDLSAVVQELAEEVLTTPPSVRSALKNILYEQLPTFRSDVHYLSAVSSEFASGIAAFTNRQPAPWTAQAVAGATD